MGTAQNFFNATPAPDPQQNPIMAGLAGGLQGMSDQGNYQKQMALMQYQNQQKQMADMLNAGAQNHQAGFGQGPEGSTPMQIGGQQGYWDPNGMSPAGQMDLSKAQLYQTMNNQKAGASQNLEAHTLATTLLKGIADRYSSGQDKNYTQDNFFGDAAAAVDYVKKKYGMDKPQEDDQQDATQPWQPGQPKTEAQSAMAAPGGQTAVQQMFSSATGSKTSSTPRSQKLTADVAAAILKQAGGDKQKARAIAKQQGFTF